MISPVKVRGVCLGDLLPIGISLAALAGAIGASPPGNLLSLCLGGSFFGELLLGSSL